MAQPLLVVGSIAFDSVKTPHGEVEDVLGGSATYFSVAASFYGPVRLVGAVGEDFPDGFRETFERRDIDTSGLQTVDGGETFRWRGSYAGDMNEANTDEVHLNVLGDFDPDLPETFRDSKLVFLANGSPVTQKAVVDQMHDPALVMADTMNLWIETQRDELIDLLGHIDGLLLNDGEARMLTEETNLISAGEQILTWGPSFVVIKKGEHGALLTTRGGTTALPGFPSQLVRDPTGAGDSFAGGMMGYLASQDGYDPSQLKMAMAHGTVAASLNIEDFSLRRFEAITRKDIDERLETYRRMLAL